MRYCVLGGGGSFGLAVSRFLLEQPTTEQVVGIGRNPPKANCFTVGTGDGDPRYRYYARHITYECDLLLELLKKLRPDVIINFAAQGEGAASFSYSWRYFETNAMALVYLFERLLADSDYLPRFIHIGTSELYGSTGWAVDEEAPIRPTSPYAASKAAFDLYLLSAFQKFRYPLNIIRPSNCYGPGQQLHRLIPRAILCGFSGVKMPLHGGGAARKSYMHTDDLSTAIWTVLQKGVDGEVYNAGPPVPISILEIVEMIAESLDTCIEQLCAMTDDRAHQDSQYWLDSAKLNQLGWEPKVTWVKGLASMVDWVREYPELQRLPQDFVMRA